MSCRTEGNNGNHGSNHCVIAVLLYAEASCLTSSPLIPLRRGTGAYFTLADWTTAINPYAHGNHLSPAGGGEGVEKGLKDEARG
ncbi:MAG: hypothetical protein FJ266_03035 [Planctomycetes bacterium]|nr:hypothetical protein [Planctomycetota bacterium]